MAKVVLGDRPKSFEKVTVTCALPEGGTGEIGVIYKYRTRTQYAEFTDAIYRAANMKPAGVPGVAADTAAASGVVDQASESTKQVEAFQFSLAEAMRKSTAQNADFIMDALDGWDLDRDFSRKNVEQLCDELPGGAFAIIERYRLMCLEGRLGN